MNKAKKPEYQGHSINWAYRNKFTDAQWRGTMVRTNGPIRNGFTLLPEGTVVEIHAKSPGGFTITAPRCEHCQISPSMTRVDPQNLSVISPGEKADYEAKLLTRAAAPSPIVVESGPAKDDDSIAVYGEWEMDLRQRIEAQRMDWTEIAECVSEIPRLFKVIDALRSELGREGGRTHDLSAENDKLKSQVAYNGNRAENLAHENKRLIDETYRWSDAVKKLEAERAAAPSLVEEVAAPAGWVSVDERLPEFGEGENHIECNVLAGGRRATTADYRRNPYAKTEKGKDARWEKYFRLYVGATITHWQPLPAAPTA